MKLSAMKVWAAWVIIGACWAARGAEPGAATEPGGPPATGPAMAVDAHWQDVVTRLGSTTYSEREAATKELASLSYKQMDLLKQLAAGATDAEAKSRLLNRITQIEEELAYSPPPISVDVQNGSLGDVAAALGKGMGITMDSWPPRQFGGQGQPLWTISAKEKPFWDIVLQLEQQRGFSFQDNNNQIQLMQQDPGLKKGFAFGGLCVFPQSITRSRTANLQQAAGNQMQPEQMYMTLLGVLDPRVAVSNSMGLEFTKVVDDLGNSLYDAPANQQTNWNNFGGRPAHMWNQSVQLNMPGKPGKKIVSAKGQLRLLVQLGTEKVEVTELEKKLNTALKVGNKTVTFQQFEPQPDNQSVRFNMQTSGPGRSNGTGADVANAPVTVAFIDSTGKTIWGQTFQGGSGGSFGGQFVPPLKVVMSVPTKVKEVTIPFELKDLPLP